MSPTTTQEQPFRVALTLRSGYEIDADFGLAGVAPLHFDEPIPLGDGHGPNAARVLAAAVGNCLASSLLFCLRKARVEVRELRGTVEGTLSRNAAGRLRIAGLRVRLEPVVPLDQQDRTRRCMELYEDFCMVSQSVGAGIPITTEVVARGAPTEVVGVGEVVEVGGGSGGS